MTSHFRPYDAHLDREACLTIFDSNTPPFFDVTERTLFEAFLDRNPHPYFVITDGPTVVACGGIALYPDESAGVALDEKSAGLNWGMVARQRHASGLGTLLLVERLSWLRAHLGHLQEVRIATSQFTSGYYERHGFRIVTREPDGFAPGLDRVEMHRPLGG